MDPRNFVDDLVAAGTSAAIGLNRIAENCNLSTSNIENLLRSAITNMLIIGYGFVGIFAIYTLSQCILIWYKLQKLPKNTEPAKPGPVPSTPPPPPPPAPPGPSTTIGNLPL